MNKEYKIKLDLNKKLYNKKMAFNQFDENVNDFYIEVTKNNKVVKDLDKSIITLVAIKPNNAVDAQFIEVKEGQIYADLKPSMCDIVGNYQAKAMIVLEGEIVTTDTINYSVNEDKIISKLNDDVVNDERFALFTDALARLSDIEASEEQRIVNESERILSEENRKIEEAKRVEAELIRQHEEADRAKYDATRESNENIRKINEETRISSENVRLENEANRIEQEANRVKAEQLRKDNYNLITEDEERRRLEANAHKEAEVLRVQAETNRVNEEAKRRTTEQARVSAENTRVSNENTRKANETTRQNNETHRVEAETQRQNRYNSFILEAEANANNFENYTNNAKIKEEERKSNELNRKSQEDRRVSNEVERISNENARKANENARIESEKQRVDAENLRKEKIVEIQSDYDSLKKVIIDENASANLQNQINQTNSQLEQKANEADLQTQKSRIDNIVKLEEGSTTGDAELIDARVGKDGTIYKNTGDAIRSQYELLHSSLDGVKQLAIGVHEINTTSYEGKYLNKTGGWSIDSNLHSKVTDKIVCSPGWVFSYKGKGGTNAVSWIMYSGNTLVEIGFYDNNKVATEVVIPVGVDSIKFGSYNSLSNTVVLDVKLVSNTQVTTDNITSSLKSSIGIYQLDDNLKNIVKYDVIDISDSLEKIDNVYIDCYGSIVNNNLYDCYDLNVSEGEVFSYVGQIVDNLAPYYFYDASDKIVKIGGDGKPHNTAISVNIDELIIPPGVTKLRVCSGTSGGRAKFTLNKLTPFAPLVENDINKLIETHKYEGLGDYTDVTGNYELVTGQGYMNSKGGINDTSDTKGQYSQYIPINDFNTIYISAYSIYATCIMVILDEGKNFLGAKGSASVEGETIWDLKAFNREEILQEYPNAYYIRLGTYEYTKYPLKMYVKKSNIYDIVNNLENTINKSNILYKKKWVACGDSFTEGDFNGYVDENGLSEKNSPVIYDGVRRMYKTYPWWIAERNTMELINEAKCGSDFTNIEGASNPFSVSRYLAIPTDADYITLMFGLNETDLTTEQIGTKTDTTNSTLWGAYNIVFEYFLTNMPYAKIGVIIADAGMNETYANAVKSICAYWGIPVLDLKFDTNIPMGLSGRPNGSSIARQLRDNAFKVTSTNSHPNLEAHKYRSTFIEHWLRSL